MAIDLSLSGRPLLKIFAVEIREPKKTIKDSPLYFSSSISLPLYTHRGEYACIHGKENMKKTKAIRKC